MQRLPTIRVVAAVGYTQACWRPSAHPWKSPDPPRVVLPAFRRSLAVFFPFPFFETYSKHYSRASLPRTSLSSPFTIHHTCAKLFFPPAYLYLRDALVNAAGTSDSSTKSNIRSTEEFWKCSDSYLLRLVAQVQYIWYCTTGYIFPEPHFPISQLGSAFFFLQALTVTLLIVANGRSS